MNEFLAFLKSVEPMSPEFVPVLNDLTQAVEKAIEKQNNDES